MWITVLLTIPVVFLFGPGAGAVLALSNGFSPFETALLVSLIHVGLVPVWFGIFEILGYVIRYRRRIMDKFSKHGKLGRSLKRTAKSNIREFEKRVGQLGLGIGTLVFTFIFGVSWATLMAFVLDIKKETIFISVSAGALVSSIFWTAVFSGLKWFVPNLWLVYVIGFVLIPCFMMYNKEKERKVVEEISRTLSKIGARK